MSATVLHDARVLDLVREAARWRLAGLLLRRPRTGWREEIATVAPEVADPALDRAVAKAMDASEGVYLAILGPGGPVSPRGVSYRPIEDPGRLLAEIAAFHEAFAYRAGAEDPRDHAAVSADFVGFLTLKEAYARGAGRDDDAETTCEARERFVARHVRAVAGGMMRRLERIDCACEYLPAAVSALCELAGADAASGCDEPLGDAPFLPAGLDDAVLECGGPGGGPDACAGECSWPAPGAEPWSNDE